MKQFEHILGPMRLPFLILPPACVILGLGTAFHTQGTFSVFYLFLILAGALSAHVSVNSLNEYYDFTSGLDLRTQRTAFSGGSGTLPRMPDKARTALITGMAAFILTGLIGLYFVALRGIMLLPLGVAGLIIIFTYTIWLTRSPLFCLIAPGLGFGPLMVMGTDFVLTGSYSWTAFAASLIPFFLVSNLLLMNQFPDIDADRSIGRRHLIIAFGRTTGIITYGSFLAAAYVSIIIAVAAGLFPAWCLLGLASIPVAGVAFFGLLRHARDIPKLAPFMGLNVAVTIITPLLTAAGFFITL